MTFFRIFYIHLPVADWTNLWRRDDLVNNMIDKKIPTRLAMTYLLSSGFTCLDEGPEIAFTISVIVNDKKNYFLA